jgi:hypothetical protein
MLDNPLVAVLVATLFPLLVLGAVVLLSWLERPHQVVARTTRHVPTHRAGTPS